MSDDVSRGVTRPNDAVWIAPPEEVVARRRALGLDLLDEVWGGVYHMAPNPHIRHGMVDQELAYLLQPLARRAGLIGTGTFNLGAPDDFRVPDRGLHRNPQLAVFVPTAAMVVEILSPGDETFAKFHFFAAHGVGEIMVADPDLRTIRLWRLRPDGAGYREVQRSALLAVSTTELTEAVRWP